MPCIRFSADGVQVCTWVEQMRVTRTVFEGSSVGVNKPWVLWGSTNHYSLPVDELLNLPELQFPRLRNRHKS